MIDDRSAEDALMTKWVAKGARRGSTPLGRMADIAKRPPLWAGFVGVLAVSGPRARRAALRASAAYAAATTIHLPIKLLVGRRHPPGASSNTKIGPVLSSFPSGHTAGELAFAIGAAQELPLLFIPLYAATLASEWSLIRSRAHYPSDIMAGGGIAIAVALLAAKLWPSHRSVERRDAAEDADSEVRDAGAREADASPQPPVQAPAATSTGSSHDASPTSTRMVDPR